MAYGPKVSLLSLSMGVTASETRQGGSQQIRKRSFISNEIWLSTYPFLSFNALIYVMGITLILVTPSLKVHCMGQMRT